MKKLACFSVVSLWLVGGSWAGAPDDRPNKVIHEAFGTMLPPDPHAEPEPTPRPVSLDMPDAFQDRLNTYDFGWLGEATIAAADARSAEKYANFKPGPMRVGLTRTFDPAPLTIQDALVAESELPDGRRLWTLAIRSPGAHGMRLHFTEFDAGDAAVLVYAYGPAGLEVRGPFSKTGPGGVGDFWTSILPGDQVFVEITGHVAPEFQIAGVLHMDRDPDHEADGGIAAPLSCHLDAMCESLPPYVLEATAKFTYVDDGDGQAHVCTGTLLNDLDDETYAPYFITARHCISSAAEARSMDIRWFYQKDACGGATPVESDYPLTHSATLLRSYSENDMAFLRLDEDPPAGVAFVGWTTNTSVSNAVGVHHPRGSWKRAVFLSATNVCVTCWCGDPTDFDYYDYRRGLTEPGSSGSGVFNGAGQFAGQLKGCCSDWADCDDKSCSNLGDYWAYYGEFETTYDEISHWLHLGGTVNVNWFTLPGMPETGTPGFPFDTVTEGYNYAWNGARIKIAAGEYPERITFAKDVLIVGAGGDVIIGPR